MDNSFEKEFVRGVVSKVAERKGMVKGAAITASGMSAWIADSIFEVVTSEEYKNYIRQENTHPSSKED